MSIYLSTVILGYQQQQHLFVQGIGGVVRKTVNEELAENIWNQQHMDKIIPSLLYNIQIADYKVFHSNFTQAQYMLIVLLQGEDRKNLYYFQSLEAGFVIFK